MKRTINFYSDAGHGWGSVLLTDLQALNIADKVSTYSYQRGRRVYLEEDCDLSLFVQAARAAGWTVIFKEHNHPNYSPIRNFDHYRARVNPLTLGA